MSNTSKSRPGLGRGLDAIIPSGQIPPDAMAIAQGSGPLAGGAGFGGVAVLEVPIDAIVPNHQQPRSPIDDRDDALRELADSIREHGILQPLIVALDGDDGYQARYQLIAGERRWRAAQLAGLATVPVVLRDATQREMLELALVENLQRTDLNPLEAAHGYKMLMEEYGLTQDQVAERVGRGRSTVTNTLRLLQLPAEVREMLMRVPDIFTEGHARAVLAINGGDGARIQAMQFIVANKLTVRQAEEYAKKHNDATLRLTPDRRGAGPRVQSLETQALQEEFIRAIEMKARLQRTTRGNGSLTLYFTNEQQLQVLYQRLVAAGEAGGFGFDAGGGLSAMDDMIQNGFDRADREYRGHGGNGRGSGN